MLKDKIINLYKNGFFHIFTGNILNKLFAFVSSIIVVRLVSKVDYASLTYADNIYSYVTLFAGLGMSTAILKYCCSDNKGKNKAYIKFALKYGTLVQIGLIIILLLYTFFADIPFSGVKNLVYIYCLYPVMEYGVSVFYNAVRALLKNKLYVKMSVLQTAAVMILGIILVYLIGIKGLFTARYIAVIIPGILGILFLTKEFQNVIEDKLTRQEKNAFMSMAVSLLIANLFSMIMPLNETLLINNLIRDEVITANYKAATLFPAQLTFISSSIMVYYFPIIARIKDRNEIWKLSVTIGIFTGTAVLAIAITGALLSKYIIFFTYGKRYMDAVETSRIFWFVYSLNAGLRMIPMNILPAAGHARFNAIAAGISCVIHFCLDYFMISNAGISGVAAATSVVYLLSGIAYWIYLYVICKKERNDEVGGCS